MHQDQSCLGLVFMILNLYCVHAKFHFLFHDNFRLFQIKFSFLLKITSLNNQLLLIHLKEVYVLCQFIFPLVFLLL